MTAPAQASGAGHDGHDHGSDDHGHEGHDHDEGGHEGEVKLTAEAIERYGIRVEPAQMWMLKPTLTAPGRVTFNAEAMAHVGSAVSGRAVEIKVKRGDSVAAGDELVIVESPELGEAQAQYLQQQAAAQSAGPAVELARTAWERAKTLHEQSEGIALSEVQRRQGEYQAALAAQKAAGAALIGGEHRLRLMGLTDAAIESLERTGQLVPRLAIRAPIAGQVIEREVTLGELIGPDRESLVTLADMSTLWVLAEVPGPRLHEVALGGAAWVRLGGADGPASEGQVAFVSPFVDPSTRTAQVRVVVGADLTLRPGMFAEVEIVASDPAAGDPEPTVAVPDQAIQLVEGATSIFVPVEGEANTFQRRTVRVGKSVGGLVPVHGGLVDGERYIAAGTFILKAELGKGSAEHVH